MGIEDTSSGDARLRAAVESSPSGLLMVDADGRIVLVNREIERLFGYSRDELLGRPVEMLVPRRLRGAHTADRAGFIRSSEARPMGAGRDLFGLRKDGVEVPVEIGLTPVPTKDGLYVLGSIVDITARKNAEAERQHLEQQLRQAQKMEAVGTLAGGIAHDFNNILGTIVGFAELARDGLSDRPAVVADLDELLEACERGKQLVQRILRFSRRQEPVSTPIDLASLTTEAGQLLRAAMPARIRLNIEVAPVPTILADVVSVQQVLMNLATNAAHAMPDGGDLDVCVGPTYVRDSMVRRTPGLREGPYASLRVRDHGIGIEPANLSRVFEPFFTTKPVGEGSGLGLAIVHGIMRDHGGAVLIESEPGRGTEVQCLFPIAEQSESEAPDLPSSVPHGSGQQVLVLDDEPALARLGQRRMESLGYRALAYTDPAGALAAIQQAPGDIHLVIADYSMPGMTGLEFARRVSAIRADLPIVMATGYMDQFGSQELTAAGVKRLLTKPVTIDELGRVAAELLGTS